MKPESCIRLLHTEHFAAQYMTRTTPHFLASWLASLSLLCIVVFMRAQDLGSICSAAHMVSRQLGYGFSYAQALLCCVSMTADLGTRPAMIQRTAYARYARSQIA